MEVPKPIKKYSVENGDEIVVKTTTGRKIQGVIEYSNRTPEFKKPDERTEIIPVVIDTDVADELGSAWCHIDLVARRNRSGWSDVEASYVTAVDDDGSTESTEALGTVEEIDRVN